MMTMRSLVMIPISIATGFGIFALIAHHTQPTVPGQAFIGGMLPAVQDAQAYLLPVANPAYHPVRNTAVADVQLDATAAVLFHVESGGELYAKDEKTRLPIASLTKLLSALVVQDIFRPDESISVASGSIRVDGERQTLYQDEQLAVQDLVSMMLVESSNDAAYALAAAAQERGVDFVELMNRKAHALGMEDCLFKDPAGLDDTAYCTASDLVRLVRAALQSAPQLWPILSSRQLSIRSLDGKQIHDIKSTDVLLDSIPGIIGGKTGNTDAAKGCMILVVKVPGKDDTLIAIVLGSRQRFTDTQNLITWAQRAYLWND